MPCLFWKLFRVDGETVEHLTGSGAIAPSHGDHGDYPAERFRAIPVQPGEKVVRMPCFHTPGISRLEGKTHGQQISDAALARR
ncbi:Uncharacterised protein [Arachnia propionica]|nr:Uncharacterised protein [Arachnia propionica]